MHLKTSTASLLCSILLASKSVVGHDHGGDDNDAQFIVGEAEVKDLQWKWGFEVLISWLRLGKSQGLTSSTVGLFRHLNFRTSSSHNLPYASERSIRHCNLGRPF
jgi:hypothetical protein